MMMMMKLCSTLINGGVNWLLRYLNTLFLQNTIAGKINIKGSSQFALWAAMMMMCLHFANQ